MTLYGTGLYGGGTYSSSGSSPPAAVSTGMPTVSVDVSFSTIPTAAPNWAVVTPYVHSCSVRRGRQFELARMETGIAQVLFDNQDRRFDPSHTSSPYAPDVLPRKRLRIQATWAGITYSIFTGYVESWPQSWSANGKVAHAAVTVTDAFVFFGGAKLNTSYPVQLAGARIGAVLDTLNWGAGQAWVLGDATYGVLGTTATLGPVGDRSIGLGSSQIQASDLVNETALSHMQNVAETENGLLYMGQDGEVVFQGRHVRLQSPYTTAQATFGDANDGVELPYHNLVFDQSPIWNEVRLTRNGGEEQLVEDGTSQVAYFIGTYQRSGLLQETDSEVASAAAWWLDRYRNPSTRISAIEIMPQRDSARLWPAVLAREIGDRVVVKRRPPGGGTAISQDSFIEAIEHTISPSGWMARFSLSPADVTTDYWILGTSLLGTTSRIAY